MHPPSKLIKGVVNLQAGSVRTLYGSTFKTGRYERIEFSACLPEDERTLQAACEPLRQLFPFVEWEAWRVEVLNDHDVVASLSLEEQTLRLDRRALSTPLLLAWETYNVFLQVHLLTTVGAGWTDLERRWCAFLVILHCVQQEPGSKQEELLQELHSTGESNAALLSLLRKVYLAPIKASVGPPQRLRVSPQEEAEAQTERLAGLSVAYVTTEWQMPEGNSFAECWPSLLHRAQNHLSLHALFSWQALCSPLFALLSEFVRRVDLSDSSTTRRLTLFRLSVEHGLESSLPNFQGVLWPLLSLAALDPGRHPRIHQALQQFVELHHEESHAPLFSVPALRGQLVRLSIQNNLSEQDDRFFRQATHLQSIWRDILHRNASQAWASRLLFDALEGSIEFARRDTNLLFASVMQYEDERFDPHGDTVASEIQNLHELLWVLSQSSAEVLRRLFPRDEEEADKAQERWPLLRTHLRHYLHLAPNALLRLLQQIEEESDERHRPEKEPFAHVELDADPEIPHQELHGRILPLLARPGVLEEYAGLSLEEIFQMRVIELNRTLSHSSGNWEEERLSSCFLIQFKTIDNYWRGHWTETALWIEKELDLNKVKGRKDAPPTFDSLLHQDGIWQRTYRYQFSSLDHLLLRLKPKTAEWNALLDVLTQEYYPLFTLQLRLVLDYHYYLHRWHRYGGEAFFGQPEGDAPAMFQWSPEEFEQRKASLADLIAEEGLASLRKTLQSDHRSWGRATQVLQGCLDSMEQWFRFSPEEFLESDEPAVTVFQRRCREWMLEGTEPLDDMEEVAVPWDQDKIALLEQLQQCYPAGAQAFVRFLLEQLTPDLHVVELLCHSMDELEEVKTYHPIVKMRGHRQNEFLACLRNAEGRLLPPDFLPFVTKIPVELLRELLEEDPSYYETLKRAALWLRRLDIEQEEVMSFWKLLETLKPESPPVPLPEEPESLGAECNGGEELSPHAEKNHSNLLH